MSVAVGMSDQIPGDVARILDELPAWFGRPDSNAAYVRDAQQLVTFAARTDGLGDHAGKSVVVGFVVLRLPTARSAEVHLMAVTPSHQRQGIGRALLDAATVWCRNRGLATLAVRTLGPTNPDPAFAQTRAFYEAARFEPVQETDEWGADTPCLLMVRPVSRPTRGVRVRDTDVADLPDLRRLWNDGEVTKFVGFPDGIGVSDDEMRAWWRQLMASRDQRHFTVETDDLGYCGEAFYRYRHDDPSDLDIKLLPKARGRSLGGIGLGWALDRLFAETDAQVASVSPHRDNHAARRLYSRAGFLPAAPPIQRPEFAGGADHEYLEITRDRWLADVADG